jgi:hypothetical protein
MKVYFIRSDILPAIRLMMNSSLPVLIDSQIDVSEDGRTKSENQDSFTISIKLRSSMITCEDVYMIDPKKIRESVTFIDN